jgi:hypothetical protein
MAIELDDARFRKIIDATLVDRIDASEIRAVITVAQLAASIDLDDDPGEQALLGALTHRLCELGGIDADSIGPLSPVPTDDEERAACLERLAPELASPGARELAYVLAYLMIAVDLELAPIEAVFLDELLRKLHIAPERAGELVEMVSEIVTPPERPARPGDRVGLGR